MGNTMNPVFALAFFSAMSIPTLKIERMPVSNDTFTFKTNDGQLDSNIATVTVRAAVISSAQPKMGTLVATDADNDALTYSIVMQGSSGIAFINDSTTGAFTYTPFGRFVLTMTGGDPIAEYHLQRSGDLTSWNDIAVFLNGSGSFIDRQTSERQFYRLATVAPLPQALRDLPLATHPIAPQVRQRTIP